MPKLIQKKIIIKNVGISTFFVLSNNEFMVGHPNKFSKQNNNKKLHTLTDYLLSEYITHLLISLEVNFIHNIEYCLFFEHSNIRKFQNK